MIYRIQAADFIPPWFDWDGSLKLMKAFLVSVTAGVLLLHGHVVRAQSVFSLNAVGYVDLPLYAGSNLVANPLNAASNTVAFLFPNLPDGSYFLPWNQQTRAFDSTNRYVAATGWSDPNAVFVLPDAGFLVLPTAGKISFHGEPWQFANGPGCLTYPAGESLSGWYPSGTCGICEPEACPPFGDGTVVSTWDPVFQVSFDYVFFGGFGWVPSEPMPVPGHGFRLSNPQVAFGRSPFQGSLVPSETPLQHGRPFRFIRDVMRSGTNLTFRVEGEAVEGYSVLSTTNLGAGLWRVITTETNAEATIMTRADGSIEFYKVHPPYGQFPILISRGRTGNSYSFDFFAPTNGSYEIQRSAVFPADSFDIVSTVTASANTVVTVVDDTAASPVGFYRVARREDSPGERSSGHP
jgi:hypothetical protein